MLAAAKKLKLVQSQSAGVDFLMNFPELVESDVVLSNTRGAHAPSIAEHAFGLLLVADAQDSGLARLPAQASMALGRCVSRAARDHGEHDRHSWVWADRPGDCAAGSGFEVQMLAVDVYPGGGDRFVETVWPVDRLPDMLAMTDILMVAAPLTRETHHMLGAKEFATMPPNSIVIAVSRGGIIDEAGAGGVACNLVISGARASM